MTSSSAVPRAPKRLTTSSPMPSSSKASCSPRTIRSAPGGGRTIRLRRQPHLTTAGRDHMRRRALLSILGTSLFAVSAITAVAACTARAEDYPTRPIKIVSPHPVGVATDILGRALALKLNESLGRPVIVENRPGANGMIAAGQIAKASPDGYTLHITTGAHIANAFVAKDLPYDVIKDFAPVTQLAASYGLALITNLPVKSVAELVELAKKRQLSYATNGVGNITHVAGLLFDARTGT